MKLIAHRLNSLEKLKKSPIRFGVEVDVRSNGKCLIMHHDPFCIGESLDEWLQSYQHGTLILNVKEEGLEGELIALMHSSGITDYFFLDQSFPFLVKWSKQGEHRSAVRVSEFESIETVLTLTGKVDWVWVDCFSRFPLSQNDVIRLHQAGFKLCIVSPELQGRNAEIEIPKLSQLLSDLNIKVEAVCTKYPEIWEKLTNS